MKKKQITILLKFCLDNSGGEDVVITVTIQIQIMCVCESYTMCVHACVGTCTL